MWTVRIVYRRKPTYPVELIVRQIIRLEDLISTVEATNVNMRLVSIIELEHDNEA